MVEFLEPLAASATDATFSIVSLWQNIFWLQKPPSLVLPCFFLNSKCLEWTCPVSAQARSKGYFTEAATISRKNRERLGGESPKLERIMIVVLVSGTTIAID